MEEHAYAMRPHHVYLLLGLAKVDESIREEYVRNRMNDFSDPVEKASALLDFAEFGRPMKYRAEFTEEFVRLYTSLLERPYAKIEVVDGLDCVCALGGGCGRKIQRCERESYESIEKLEGLGVRVGDVLPLYALLEK